MNFATTEFLLTSEPEGKVYHQLLDLANSICPYALLITRHETALSQTGQDVLARLSPFLVDEKETNEWPGTLLINHTALVSKFRLEPDCISILKETAKSLYQWQQPDLPEDLCLLRPDDSTWMLSISHEEDGSLFLSKDEIKQIQREAPFLHSILNLRD